MTKHDPRETLVAGAAPASEPFPLDPEALAAEIDLPLADWPGNCHHVACLVRDLVPVPDMRIARGHFTGPVARGSIYHGGPQQHTWLLLADGRILDPTRWAMTRPERPEVYLGLCDQYDEGGRAMAAAVPPPFPGTGPDLTAPLARPDAEHRTARSVRSFDTCSQPTTQ